MVTIPGSPAAENKASGEGSGRVGGKQGREDGSALSRAGFLPLQAKSRPVEQKSIM